VFLRVLAAEPAHVGARFGLSLTYIDQGRDEEAAAELERVLAADPRHAQARRLASVVRERLGEAAPDVSPEFE